MILPLAMRWLHRHGWLLAGVLLGLVLFELGLVGIASEFEGGAKLEQVVDLLPSFFQQLVKDKLRNFSTDAIVSLGFNHPVAVTVLCSITALLATSPAADREEGLLGLLLAQPVSRRTYLLGAALPVLLLATLQPAALLTGGVLGLNLVQLPTTLPWTVHLETALGLACLLVLVGGLALLLAVLAPRRGVAVTRLAAILVPLYLVEFLGFLWSGLDALRWLSPFHYLPQLPSALGAESVSGGPWLLLAAGLALGGAAFALFDRRDP